MIATLGTQTAPPVGSVPTLRPLRSTHPLDRRGTATIAVVGGFTLAAALLVRPWVGIVIGLLCWWAVVSPRGRTVLRWLPGSILAAIDLHHGRADVHEIPAAIRLAQLLRPGEDPDVDRTVRIRG